MSLSMISFTRAGCERARQLKSKCDDMEITLYTKWSKGLVTGDAQEFMHVTKSITMWAKEQLEERNGLVFIGACGIAVRAIAPSIQDKLSDSPVLVIDELGNYVIPILSGHVGGANELAYKLADCLGAVAVITTATDCNKAFAVDLFAKENGFFIVNKEGIALISAKVYFK